MVTKIRLAIYIVMQYPNYFMQTGYVLAMLHISTKLAVFSLRFSVLSCAEF